VVLAHGIGGSGPEIEVLAVGAALILIARLVDLPQRARLVLAALGSAVAVASFFVSF